MAYTTLTPAAEDTLLKQIRERYDLAVDHWGPIQKNGAKNLRYVAGDPWDAKDRKAREDAGRPCISLDEITQYTNQVVNQLRAKRRSVVFTANGNGANDDTARFYQDKWREIEYRSKAQIVYTTGAQNMVERGYGFCRIKTKYTSDEPRADEDINNQDIWLEEIVNPDMVLPDPDAKRPTFSDMQDCFVHETRSIEAFKREFPKARITDFSGDALNLAPKWIREKDLVIAEYWHIKTVERELVRLKANGQTTTVYGDELPTMMAPYVVARRPVKQPRVCMYLTNGVEILEKTDWPGKYIPIAGCVGKVLYLDRGAGVEVLYLSMVDLMRDPQMLHAYLATNEAELVGMSPKTPWIGYTGQFRTRKDVWDALNQKPVPYAEADPLTEATGSQILPLPQRQVYDPPIQSLEILKESTRRSIQAAAGSMPLPTQAQRRNEKSGVALKEMRETGQVGSYHFSDHYDDFIEHVGVMGEDLMDKIYDTARDVTIRKANETAETVRINDPRAKKPVSTKGSHLVTVSTGPSFESERDAATDLADTLLTLGDPEVARAVMPLAIKLKNLGAIGDELVELTEALQPPAIQMLRAKDGEEPTPQMMMGKIAQQQEQLQHAEAALAELSKDAEGKQLDAETKKTVAQMQGEIELQKARMDNATKIAIAHINAATKGVALDAHAEEEAIALAHDAAMQELAAQQAADAAMQDRDHDLATRGVESDLSAEEAEAQRAHEAEMAAQAQAATPTDTA